MAEAVYLMCAVTSLACAALLIRSYRRSHMRLILWTSLCFLGLAANNLLLVVDLAIIESIDFRIARAMVSLAGVAILLWGMIVQATRREVT
jgi:hypothetical protein